MIIFSNRFVNSLSISVILAVSLAFFGSLTFGQNIYSLKYRLRDRRGLTGKMDRREGIELVKIAGEKLYLFSMLFNTQASQSEGSPAHYRLGFFLPQDENKVHIQVRDYDFFKGSAHYWMLPTQTQYENGFHEFTWPTQLSLELGIQIRHLGALAEIRGHGHLVIAPLILQADLFSTIIEVQGCQFIFLPNETMTVEYVLFPKENEQDVVITKTVEKWHKNKKNIIDWQGKTLSGQPAENGWYLLRLKAYITPLGKPTERIPYDYEFYYKSKIKVRANMP